MPGLHRVMPLPTPKLGGPGSAGAFKSLFQDPCCVLFLYAELQQIHKFKPVTSPHPNSMVSSTKLKQLLPSHKDRS